MDSHWTTLLRSLGAWAPRASPVRPRPQWEAPRRGSPVRPRARYHVGNAAHPRGFLRLLTCWAHTCQTFRQAARQTHSPAAAGHVLPVPERVPVEPYQRHRYASHTPTRPLLSAVFRVYIPNLVPFCQCQRLLLTPLVAGNIQHPQQQLRRSSAGQLSSRVTAQITFLCSCRFAGSLTEDPSGCYITSLRCILVCFSCSLRLLNLLTRRCGDVACAQAEYRSLRDPPRRAAIRCWVRSSSFRRPTRASIARGSPVPSVCHPEPSRYPLGKVASAASSAAAIIHRSCPRASVNLLLPTRISQLYATPPASVHRGSPVRRRERRYPLGNAAYPLRLRQRLSSAAAFLCRPLLSCATSGPPGCDDASLELRLSEPQLADGVSNGSATLFLPLIAKLHCCAGSTHFASARLSHRKSGSEDGYLFARLSRPCSCVFADQQPDHYEICLLLLLRKP